MQQSAAVPPTADTARLASSPSFVAGDPIRGLLSVLVIFVHAAAGAAVVNGIPDGQHAVLFGSELGHVLDIALFAVPGFFVLSGYLLARPFVQAFHRGAPTAFSLSDYAWRRFVRIVPAFLVVAVIAILAFGDGSTLPQVLAVLAFAQVYDASPAGGAMVHGWTLDAEVFFYVGLPLFALAIGTLAWKLPARARSPFAIAAVLFIPFAGWALFTWGGVEAALSAATPWALLRSFLPGVLFAIVEVHYRERLAGWAHGRGAALAMVVAGFALATIGAFNLPGGELFNLAALLIVGGPLLMQRTGHGAWRAVDNRPLHWLGQHSYGIYLAHWPLLLTVRPWFEDLGPRPAFVAFLSADLVLSCLAAAVLWRLVEEPALRQRHRFRRKATNLVLVRAPEVTSAA